MLKDGGSCPQRVRIEIQRILPGLSAAAKVQLGTHPIEGPVLLQQTEVTEKLGLYISEGKVQPSSDGEALAIFTYKDIYVYVKNCPECTVVCGGGKVQRPPLCPIPVTRPFQILGMDIMALPKTTKGNQYALVFQDFLTKWPSVFALPDQQTDRIVKILAEYIVPFLVYQKIFCQIVVLTCCRT